MTNDTTTVPIGADAALALLVAAVEAETDPSWECNSYHPSLWSALDVARAALASAAQPAPAPTTYPEREWCTAQRAFIRGWDQRGMAHDLKGSVETDCRMRDLMNVFFPRDPTFTAQPAPTQPADKYPPLPTPDLGMPWRVNAKSDGAAHSSGFTDSQMRAYVDADRAARGDAKRRWMQIADQRAIEVADLKAEVKRLRATAEQSSVGQEPVAWRCWDDDHNSRWSFTVWPHESDKGAVWEPLYTHPAPQPAPVAQGGTTFGLPYGIIDPDYARVYTTARILAWQYGFALTMHGSFTRDLDLVLVPWARNAFNDAVDRIIKMLCEACDLSWDGTCGDKPHGRKAYTLVFKKFSDPRWIDLSVLPVPAPVAQGDALDAARYRCWRDAMIEDVGLQFTKAVSGALPDAVGASRRPTAHEWDAAIDVAREAKEGA